MWTLLGRQTSAPADPVPFPDPHRTLSPTSQQVVIVLCVYVSVAPSYYFSFHPSIVITISRLTRNEIFPEAINAPFPVTADWCIFFVTFFLVPVCLCRCDCLQILVQLGRRSNHPPPPSTGSPLLMCLQILGLQYARPFHQDNCVA